MNEQPDLIDLIRIEIDGLIQRYEMLGATVVVGIATADARTKGEGFTFTTVGGYFASLGVAQKLIDELRFPCPVED